MKVLVACEESQTVCKSFREKGHEAYSADILPCSGGKPEWHIQGDVLDILGDGWDMMIAHPPCTYLSNSGARWLYDANGECNVLRWDNLLKAIQFFNALNTAPISQIAVENPVPHKWAREGFAGGDYLRIGNYTQVVHPWMFGHPEKKATCLWLTNLPQLVETDNVKKVMLLQPKKLQQRIHYVSPGKDRQRIRSKTFQGLADAMADQWG